MPKSPLFWAALVPSAGKYFEHHSPSVCECRRHHGARVRAVVARVGRTSRRHAMKFPRRQFLHLATGAAALPAVSRSVWAQTYPARPVRVIVPYAPGGSNDVFGRLIAQRLSEHFAKQFYVENVGGAAGNIGMGQGARAAPDGYTIIIVPPSIVINPSLYDKVPFDPLKDFDPVTLAVTTAD